MTHYLRRTLEKGGRCFYSRKIPKNKISIPNLIKGKLKLRAKPRENEQIIISIGYIIKILNVT